MALINWYYMNIFLKFLFLLEQATAAMLLQQHDSFLSFLVHWLSSASVPMQLMFSSKDDIFLSLKYKHKHTSNTLIKWKDFFFLHCISFNGICESQHVTHHYCFTVSPSTIVTECHPLAVRYCFYCAFLRSGSIGVISRD